jgi:glycosyltransferase involved in cell wall biosynthesis
MAAPGDIVSVPRSACNFFSFGTALFLRGRLPRAAYVEVPRLKHLSHPVSKVVARPGTWRSLMTASRSARPTVFSEERPLRLAYFVSHPIQYQAPLLRRLAQEKDIDLKVFFSSDLSVRGYRDPGFGVSVKWDIPLLDGYKHEFLPVLRGAEQVSALKPVNYGIRRILRKQGFDVVWVHGYNRMANLQTIMASRSLGIPVLLRAESTLDDRPRSRKTLLAKRIFFGFLGKRISAALAIGESNAVYWRHYLGREFPIFPCSYAVDNEFFQRESAKAKESREEFRRSLGLDPGRPVILFASKLQARKRCIDLVDAYLQLAASNPTSRIPYLLIVGDGEERAVLESRAQEGAPGNIRFLGFRNQTELPRFYELCNVFVLASVDEPWGLVVNEVMNAARPVIVTDQVGCHRNLVQNGVNGYVVKAYDTRALADSLRAVLADEQTARTMGDHSLRIVRNYSFEENVGGIRQALHHVLRGFEESPR